MDPQAQEMSDAYRLGEQASVASQLYGSVLPFAAASTMASAQRAGSLLSPLTVFHGSPHRFSKFDASKIGTGEGAQAYGHGLYVAEARNVAEQYANMPHFKQGTVENPEILGRRLSKDFIGRVEKFGSVEKARQEAKELLAEMQKQNIFPAVQDQLANEIELATRYGNKLRIKPTGFEPHLYTVDLPDEQIAKMLDWDKPIKNQPEVLSIIRSQINDADIVKSFDANVEKGISGANAMKNYVQGKTQADQSAVLQKLGVPGIRYLDQGSRGKGGTSNFVVFPGEESKLRIMEVNGRPVVIDEEELRRSGLLGQGVAQ
jgi:hypothetical protein